MIEYELHRFDTDRHEFGVRLRISDCGASEVVLRMPAWIPGSYMIRDFARNVTAIHAVCANGALELKKRDKQTWTAGAVEGDLVVEYTIYAFDLSVRAAYLDRSRAYFNGPSVFLEVEGRSEEPWSVAIFSDASGQCAEWTVATTLPVADVDDRGFGRYRGHGYQQLIDHPVEIASLQRMDFLVAGVPHEVAVCDGPLFDQDRLCADISAICGEHAAMFGELPIDRYLFGILATADGYGGLEHKDSTSLMCKRVDFPVREMDKPDKNYRQFLGLCSHEYFHLWNVKRIMPAAFIEADLCSETYTELLWAFEGITSYYDDLALVRCGAVSVEDYLGLLASTMTRVMRTSGRHRQTVAESSFDAWTKFYKQDENAPNAIVSYYAKGALVAFGLDVCIREWSEDRTSLDDLMRELWQRHGKTGIGIPERGIEHVLEGMLNISFADFFSRYVYGTDELPLKEWCAALGVGFGLRGAKDTDDLGGFVAASETVVPKAKPTFGARYEALAVGVKVTHVFEGGAAQQAGIAAGDVVIALDGERVSAVNLPELLSRTTQQQVTIHYFRRDRLVSSELPVLEAAADTCDLSLLTAETVDASVLGRRAAWLRSSVAGRA